MLAHGFTIEQKVELVGAGLATASAWSPGGTEVRFGWANRNRRLDYFVIIRRGAALGVCSAGEITNVTQAFQPSGRLS